MLIIILLFSFFITLNASDVISAEEFLKSFTRRFRGDYRYQSLLFKPSEDLITVHWRSGEGSREDAPTLVQQLMTGESESLVNT